MAKGLIVQMTCCHHRSRHQREEVSSRVHYLQNCTTELTNQPPVTAKWLAVFLWAPTLGARPGRRPRGFAGGGAEVKSSIRAGLRPAGRGPLFISRRNRHDIRCVG